MRWRAFLPAAIFLGVRALGVATLAVLCAFTNNDLVDRLTAWDGQWYLRIAARGYALGYFTDSRGLPNFFTPRAFFPAYPLLIRTVSLVSGLNVTAAALTATLGCGLAAAYGVARLGRLAGGGSPRAGYLLVALFAAGPMSIALSMTYTEAMFCALAAWALVGVLERRWWLAGVACAISGLVRSSAFALIVAVVLAALVCAVRGRDWRPAVAAALAPTGLVGYLWWTGYRVAPSAGLGTQLTTWSELEWQGWDTRFDWGVSTARFIGQVLVSAPYAMSVLTVGVIAGAVLLLAAGIRRRVPWPLLTYGALIMVMCLGSSGLMHAKPRFLLPAAITLLIPVARGLDNRRTGTAALAVLVVAFASAWFGAYALTVWKYAV
ncbi:MAG TPA: hypothetical protein VFG87_29160 [Amycolatopsis sp.]|nr:hypothetical protein [Amycolatopsis sp.]